MKTTTTTTSTNSSNFNVNYNKETGTLSGGPGTNAEPNYYEYCWYRLPCGICTRTNQFCPISGGSVHVDWNTPTCTQSRDAIWQVDLDGQRCEHIVRTDDEVYV